MTLMLSVVHHAYQWVRRQHPPGQSSCLSWRRMPCLSASWAWLFGMEAGRTNSSVNGVNNDKTQHVLERQYWISLNQSDRLDKVNAMSPMTPMTLDHHYYYVVAFDIK